MNNKNKKKKNAGNQMTILSRDLFITILISGRVYTLQFECLSL